ncbi:MAG: tRNA (adenosine(37)-N6)-threonylcarbamoyltransferase complex transferase subunit TsaD [Candidatus Aenigmatarchaeota archaeon]
MRAFGIESTAHTFGIGAVDLGKREVLANESVSYRPKEGIIPAECARFLEENAEIVLERAEKKLDLGKIDVIGVSQGPGLPPSLSFGLKFAKSLAERLCKPLIGVNHCRAHIEIARFLSSVREPVVLYVSGGNTQVIYADRRGNYRVLGETQDIGIGNAIDKLGRAMGLKFPAGPKIEELAKKGDFVMLPYYVKGMDLNFSGILTDATRKFEKMAKSGPEKARADISRSFQEVSFAMLAEVTERAMAALNRKNLLLVGGVAQNMRLSEMLDIMCRERGAKFYAVAREYAGDNGAMIAASAALEFKRSNTRAPEEIRPNWRIDAL